MPARAQFLVDMVDTNTTAEKGLWAVYQKTDHLGISGYFQPQFQVAQSKGIESFSGGDFGTFSNSRFILRRARIRFDYAHFNEKGMPQAQVVFQFDGSERGVVIRDFWGRFYENKWQLFSFTTGMFARPFGYEVNLSSGDRETPERGRMSQTLMRTERDLGAMVTLEPRKKSSPFRLLKLDLGVFNGQGLTGPEEYDSYKDFVGRLALKPYPVSRTLSVSGGLSMFEGRLAQNSRTVYREGETNGSKPFVVDSSVSNIGRMLPRRYRGADVQLLLKHGWGKTELRGEYWRGTQTGSGNTSLTPGTLGTEPYYVRRFQGAFIYFLQNIVNEKHLLVLKYDVYDPNTGVAAGEIVGAANATQGADVLYRTFGGGYTYYVNNNIKLMLWYDRVRNERTLLSGFQNDLRDDVFTCRVQFRF